MHSLDDILRKLQWIATATVWTGLLSIAWFASDRKPPFEVLDVYPASARPGEYITITAHVRRDLDRRCEADFSRYLFDEVGARYDLGYTQASAEMISEMDRRSPGMLSVSVKLPETMQPGNASLVSVLRYRCNNVHVIWPIKITTTMPFTVAP